MPTSLLLGCLLKRLAKFLEQNVLSHSSYISATIIVGQLQMIHLT